MKLTEGMYVRTKKGQIRKIIDMYDNSGSLHEKNYVWLLDDGTSLAYNGQKVIKASFNLIDLIKVGDYVNGYLVSAVCKNTSGHVVDIGYTEDVESQTYSIGTIQDVVTKEQFDSMKYVVERNKLNE